MMIGLSIIMIVMWGKERWQEIRAIEIWKKWKKLMKKNWTKQKARKIWKKRVWDVDSTGVNGKGTGGKA